MKARKTLLLTALALLALAGCKEKARTDGGAEQGAEASAKGNGDKSILYSFHTVLYRDDEGNGTPLYAENDEGKMVWADEAIAGDAISVYYLKKDGSEIPETKKAIRRLYNGKEEEMEFVHVRYFDEDYWTRPIFVANGSPRVVLEDTYLYSSTDLVNAKTAKVAKDTFIACSEVTGIDGIAFCKVYCYDWNTPWGKEGYIKKDALSTSTRELLEVQTRQAMERMGSDLKPFVRDEIPRILDAYLEI